MTRHTTITLALVAIVLLSPIAAASGTLIDDFEDGDIAEYSGGTGMATANGTATINGNYSLEVSDVVNGGTILNGRISRSDSVPSNADNATVLFRIDYNNGNYQTSNQLQYNGFFITDSDGDRFYITVDASNRAVAPDGQVIGQLSEDTVYQFQVSEINHTSNEYVASVWTADGTLVGEVNATAPSNTGVDPNHIGFTGTGDVRYRADDVKANVDVYETGNVISGTVTDSETGDKLTNATVKALQNGSVVEQDTTNSIGDYSLSGIENGSYTIRTSKSGYQTKNTSVTVSGDDVDHDIKLRSFNSSISINTRSYLNHGERADYSVVVNIKGDRKEVTGNSTVESNDTKVVTVDSAREEIVATSDASVNNRTYITAKWTSPEGHVYYTEKNVTVANATVKNIEILPSWTRVSVALDDQTLQAIIIAAAVGAAAALFSTSFGGIAAFTLVMMLAWLSGRVGDGMVMVAILTGAFVGMNVAGNVDYTVRR